MRGGVFKERALGSMLAEIAKREQMEAVGRRPRTTVATVLQYLALGLALLVPAGLLYGDIRMSRGLRPALEAVRQSSDNQDHELGRLVGWLRWYPNEVTPPGDKIPNGVTRGLRTQPVGEQVCARGIELRKRVDSRLVGELTTARRNLMAMVASGATWDRGRLERFRARWPLNGRRPPGSPWVRDDPVEPSARTELTLAVFPDHAETSAVATGLLEVARRCVQPDVSEVEGGLKQLRKARRALTDEDQDLASTLARISERIDHGLILFPDRLLSSGILGDGPLNHLIRDGWMAKGPWTGALHRVRRARASRGLVRDG